MNTYFRFLLALVLITSSAYAQRNGQQFIYGKLIEANSSSIRVDEILADGTRAPRDITITSATAIEGCSIEYVEKGVKTFVYLSDDTTSLIASSINFESCVFLVNVLGEIQEISGNTWKVSTSYPTEIAPEGAVLTYDVSKAYFISCEGEAKTQSDFEVGDYVFFRSGEEGVNQVAQMVQSLDDCIQTGYLEGMVVSVEDSAFTIKPNNSDNVLKIQLYSDHLIRASDSIFPLYNCDGSNMPVSDLMQGAIMNMYYVIKSEQENYLQYGIVLNSCPQRIAGKITYIDGSKITFATTNNFENFGPESTFELTSTSMMGDCSGSPLDISDLKIGMLFEGVYKYGSTGNEIIQLKAMDDCPYAFHLKGIVSGLKNGEVSITTTNEYSGAEEERTLLLDNATQYLDCSNMPITLNDVVVGSTVNVYYRKSGTISTADLVSMLNPCSVQSITGTIEAVTEQSIGVMSPAGIFTEVFVDESSVFTTCTGQPFTLSSDIIGSRIDIVATTKGKDLVVRMAQAYINCIDYGYASGTITDINDENVEVLTTEGTKKLNRITSTIVTNDVGQMVEWSELIPGRLVCFVIDNNTSNVLQGIVDYQCDKGVRDNSEGMMAMGTFEKVDGDMILVNTDMGIINFALTSMTQMVDQSRNEVQVEQMKPGSSVRIMSKGHTQELLPIASSITVMSMSAASVDESEIPQAKLMVYPNPASSIVTFGAMDYETITISTMLGQTIAQLNNTYTFDASSLTPGTYIVRATKAGKTSVTMMQITR